MAVPGIARAQTAVPNCTIAVTCFDIDGTISDSDNSGVNAITSPPLGPQALITPDLPTSGNKELGPINGSLTKVGNIHTNLTPPTVILGLTSINAANDLTKVYTQTAKDGNNHVWYYFGWIRASDRGSGVISIEFQAKKATTGCDYTKSSQIVIANCNPWQNRQGGDFMILWDQSGNSTAISMRIFQQVGNVVTLPACPTGWPDNAGVADTAYCKRLSGDDVVVTYGKTASNADDFFRGELAVDLTDTVFNPGGSGTVTCKSFANVIPNTVTGNSDTADYKDTVLFDAPDITNCGTVNISKATLPAGLAGPFRYKLSANNGTSNVFDGGVDEDCTVSGTSKATCEGVLEQDLSSDTISNLLPGVLKVEESLYPSGTFTPFSIVCTNTGTGTKYVGIKSPDTGESDLDDGLPIVALDVINCVITNTFNKTTPSATSKQEATLVDEITITKIIKHSSNANAWIRLELYSSATCSAASLVATTGQINLNGKYVDDPSPATTTKVVFKTSSVSMTGTTTVGPASIGRYWAFRYSGDDVNQGVDSDTTKAPLTCGWEQVNVTFTDTPFNP